MRAPDAAAAMRAAAIAVRVRIATCAALPRFIMDASFI
jgi:hypothetical protein